MIISLHDIIRVQAYLIPWMGFFYKGQVMRLTRS